MRTRTWAASIAAVAFTIAAGWTAAKERPSPAALPSLIHSQLFEAGAAKSASAEAAKSHSASDPRLIGIATRGPVFTGNNVMIGGFIINGTSPKTVYISARGPSMGVAGSLQDPVLDLYSNAGLIASNDDWVTSPNYQYMASSGYHPGDPFESAIVATLNPGAYTAVVSGYQSTTGIAIVEVYEIDTPGAPLIGISTRGQILSGDSVLIGGFAVQGSHSQTVVVRARGPSLPVPGAISDTVLQVFSNSSGLIASNDDWQMDPSAGQVQAAGYAPGHPYESAVMLTLPPGGYTTVVTGFGAATGVGIVEVYSVPAASPIAGTWQGSRSSVFVDFGGPPYCFYRETFSNIVLTATVNSAGQVTGGSMTATMTETASAGCPFATFGTRTYSWTVTSGSTSGSSISLSLVGNSNAPATQATFSGSVVSGRINGTLTIQRTDMPGTNLNWTLTTTLN